MELPKKKTWRFFGIFVLVTGLFGGYTVIGRSDVQRSKLISDSSRKVSFGEHRQPLIYDSEDEVNDKSTGENDAFNIIFIETSNRPFIHYRQACAVESAARSNPFAEVKLFMTGYQQRTGSKGTNENLRILNENLPKLYPNIEIKDLDVASLFFNTSLHSFYYSDLWNTTNFNVVRRSDFTRLLLLQKWGGIYLDLDFIAVKPFLDLPKNLIVKETQQHLCNCIMKYEKENPLLKVLIEKGPSTFKRKEYSATGPLLLTDTAEMYCKNKIRNLKTKNCDDVSVLEPVTFMPIHWSEWKRSFQNQTDFTVDLDQTYAVHFNNRMTSKAKLFKGSLSLYDRLAQAYCPEVYKLIPEVY